MYTEEYKQQVYKRWIESGRPWFNIDPTKEPSYAERQIIIEMKKRESNRAKRDIELDKRVVHIRERYQKKGLDF